MHSNLSFLTIVHQEEVLLPALLWRMRLIAAQLVVVVQMEPDDLGTWRIAKRMADCVYPERHFGFMEPSLEHAASVCTNPWVLQLDADETLTPGFVQNLGSLINNPNFNGYHLRRVNFVDGELQVNPENPADLQMRLWRRDRVKSFPGKRIHRTVEILEPVTSILEPCIMHEKSSQRQQANRQRYSDLIESGEAIRWKPEDKK